MVVLVRIRILPTFGYRMIEFFGSLVSKWEPCFLPHTTTINYDKRVREYVQYEDAYVTVYILYKTVA